MAKLIYGGLFLEIEYDYEVIVLNVRSKHVMFTKKTSDVKQLVE